MAEMNAKEAVEQFENFKRHGYNSNYLPSSRSIELALSLCRKLAAGELREVVHGKWALARESERCYLVKCTNCGHSVAIAANVPIDEWRAAHSYCVDCGALMEDSHE